MELRIDGSPFFNAVFLHTRDIDQFKFIYMLDLQRGIAFHPGEPEFGTYGNPVYPFRNRLSPVSFNMDAESGFMQGGNQLVIRLERRLSSRKAEHTAFSAGLNCFFHNLFRAHFAESLVSGVAEGAL